MAKLKTDPITEQDMNDFIATSSDFGFEMEVLQWFRTAAFKCQHSATYRDPITGKLRQFDIRVEYTSPSGTHTLAFAVECKNLRPNFPLLISTVPRTPPEAFYNAIVFTPGTPHSYAVEKRTGRSVYVLDKPVGKATDQVGRSDTKPNDLISNDEQTFDKMSQAINSCQGLVERFSREVPSSNVRTVIVPMLVVPAGTLWQVDYDHTGQLIHAPRQVRQSSLFLDGLWEG